MDHQLLPSLGEKLQRLNTNESAAESIFSRNASSSSVTTIYTPQNGALNQENIKKSLSFTKIREDNSDDNSTLHMSAGHATLSPSPPLSPLNVGDALELALSKVKSNTQGQPKSSNKLTTTPTNEPVVDSKWCIILVGLPAAGKSSICKNLIKQATSHFINSVNAAFKIDSFNAGNFRRKMSDYKSQGSNYFDFNNQQTKKQREEFAHIALEHLLNSLLNSQIDVGIFDATNSTVDRRDNIFRAIEEKEAKTGVKINTVILHVKCTNESFWKFNVEGKTSGPDYINSTHDEAIADFVRRADLYRKAFQDITIEELQKHKSLIYMEIDNCGKNIKINENGFDEKDDLIYLELKKFVQNYYQNYGAEYEQKVQEFWAKRK